MSKRKKNKRKKSKPKKKVDEAVLLTDLRNETDVCKNCTRYGKDANKAGICKKTGKHTARNNSCQENFIRKKKPRSTNASSGA